MAFVLDVGGGERAVVGVDTKYHERNKIEQPKPRNAARNMEVCDRSGVFAPAARRLLERSDLAVMWLEHLLLLSMLQHESGVWTWGRYVVVHPAGNTDVADAEARYRDLLADDATYATMTVEALLATRALPAGDDEGAARALPARLSCGRGVSLVREHRSRGMTSHGWGGGPMTTIELTNEDEARVEEFAGKLFMACLGAMELANVELGVRLGLYETLAGAGAMSAGELAAGAGIAERYAQEWLEQQTVAGVLEVDDVGQARRRAPVHPAERARPRPDR